MEDPTATYYDRLSRWTAVARVFGYGGGRDTLTVHRALADPRAAGRTTATRLHDLLVEALPPLDAPRVLDAGCGLGGTMIDLATRIGGTYVGLTLSDRQAAEGRRAVREAGLEARIEIRVRSYDLPPDGPFDLILAVESLAHSPDPAASLAALRARLAPGGCIAIVDDMPLTPSRGASPEASARASADLDRFKRGWRLPVLWPRERLVAALSTLGLAMIVDRDLSADIRPRTMRRIGQLTRLNRMARAFLPSPAVREMLDSYEGGLALERLYRARWMEYRLLVARESGNARRPAV
jgi:SAM-dependent methyltransferase